MFLLLFLSSAVLANASDGFDPIPEEVLRQAAAKAYSQEALAGFDGRDSTRPLLMAVRGIVFDVSAGARFYGPGTPYHVLIAKDATRAIALMSLEDEHMTDQCEALPGEAVERLNDVLRDTYLRKYPVVGHLRGGAFYPQGLCCSELDCLGCSGESLPPLVR